MISRDIDSMPIQKIPMSKKTKEWREACVNYIIGKSGFTSGLGNNGSTKYEEMQTYYNLYNSIYDERDLLYVTNPFKQKDGFPATAQDYNIIKPKVDLLLGEETKRPFNYRVVRTSDDAVSEIQQQAKQMLTDYIMATIMSRLGPEEAQRYQEALQSGEIMPPEAISKYLNKDYKDIAETTAQHTLNYLKNKLNITHEFYKGWKDALIAGEEVYYVGIINGNPYLERVNPLMFSYDQQADLEFIHDADWCCRKMIMSATQIYDRFYDKMSEKQLNQLLEMIEDTGRGGINPEVRKTSLDFPHIKTHTIGGFTSNPFDDVDDINVWHCCWKSFKKIGFVTYIDPETGLPDELQVDESYKVTGNELNVEWTWIIEVWEGYRIGEDLFVGVQPLEYQHVSADNPNSQKLPYTGVVYNNTNSRPRSLVSMMKPLQYMYIVLWYRLELAMARDKGKVPVIDVTQIPKSMGLDLNKWMHYLTALGVVFINPLEEGEDNEYNRAGGRAATFNQFTALDLSMAPVIDQYINLMSKIEDMASEITGVTKQREGAISSSELVGNVERSVIQSAHITEPWFWMHNQVKKEVLTMLLDTSKEVWKGNKRFLHYILDDTTRAFITLSDQFFYEDMDVFVDDSTKNQQQIEALRSLMQPAMQNGASLLDIAEIITMDNVNMIKNRLEEIEQKRMEQQQAMEEAQAQREQQAIQMQNEIKEEELMIKEAEMDLKKYEIDQNNATKIAVAQLNAYRGSENQDVDQNGVPDVLEIGKQALEQQKINSDAATKQLELNNKRRETEMKREIENKKIELEKQRMEQEIKLQKMKDEEAYKREQLKARTARANKVVGEK